MAFIKVKGINLYVNIKGTGHPIILVHGSGKDHTQFDIIRDTLAQHMKTISLDCRGHGLSDKPAEYALEDHIADILGLMDHYKIETTYLLGVSGGSYIAQGVAIAAAERITKLILTVPKSNGFTSSMQNLLKTHENELAGKNAHEKTLALLRYFTCNPKLVMQHTNLFENKLTSQQSAAANKALANFDFREGLSKVSAETLVISGKYDSLNSPEEGQEVASLIPDSTYIEMQYSGHLILHEEPETYCKFVEDFINRH